MSKNPSSAAIAQRAARLRQQAAHKDRRRKQLVGAAAAVVVVVVAVAVAVVVANQPRTGPPAAQGAAALAKLVAVPASVLDAAPAPTAAQVPVKLTSGQPLVDNGKPKVLYIGAEYCPFCAAERWPLIAALSKFGTFSGLTPTTSSSTDVHPDTPTFSFHGGTYTSGYLAFQAVETQDREGRPLEQLQGANAAIFQRDNPNGSIPWVTYGGTAATTGATVDANAFDGKTFEQIIAGVLNPTSDVGRTVDPAVNLITAQLCQLTQGRPGNVCTTPGVMSASVLLEK